jgi:hypothetical protein
LPHQQLPPDAESAENGHIFRCKEGAVKPAFLLRKTLSDFIVAGFKGVEKLQVEDIPS